MEKKSEFLNKAAEAGKSAAGLVSKAKDAMMKAADQNDDGKLDLKDAAALAGSIGEKSKNAAAAMKDALAVKARELELRTLQPLFEEDIDSADFQMTKLIRITEMDKKHADSEVCVGSIGYRSEEKELKVINIYRDKADLFGVTFYPDLDSEVYYVDPSDRDRYIALDDYFSYLKIARVNELQRIAQDLGAKHFRVTYKEQKTAFSEKKVKTAAKVSVKAVKSSENVDAAHELAVSETETVEIAAESIFPGHAPTQPQLHYLQRESSIQTLIEMRLDEKAPLEHQKYTLKLSNSSGIREKDALKIDAALKAMKFSGGTTVVNEARNEERRSFEYEIDF